MNIANSMLLQQLQFCSEQGFTGKLCVNNFSGNSIAEISGNCWYFIFYRGRLIGNIGGIHPIRRMKRQFQRQGIELLPSMERALAQESKTPNFIYWLLEELPSQQRIDRGKLLSILVGSMLEALFDVLRYEILWEMEKPALSYTLEPCNFADNFVPMVPIDLKALWSQVSGLLKAWKKQGLINWCPHLAPQITSYKKLQEVVPTGTYPAVVEMFDGDQSLWDIAVNQSEEIGIIGAVFLDYYHQQVVELRPVADLVIVDQEVVSKAIEQFLFLENIELLKKPLVLHLCKVKPAIQLVSEVATAANCTYVAVDDFGQSLMTCLREQPAVMLVDGRSAVDGYELCNRLYHTGKFNDIPIVLLGGQESLLGRMRGAIGSTVKYHPGSFDRQKVAEVLQQHL
jgi:two-component system, chemotaxis family, response regulator PixG